MREAICMILCCLFAIIGLSFILVCGYLYLEDIASWMKNFLEDQINNKGRTWIGLIIGICCIILAFLFYWMIPGELII